MPEQLKRKTEVAAVALALFLVVHSLEPVLAPFVVSMVLAYLGDPLTDWLESKGLSRTLSVVCVFLLFFWVLITALLVVIPALGVIHSLGLTMIGLQFAILIGMFAGLASIIP